MKSVVVVRDRSKARGGRRSKGRAGRIAHRGIEPLETRQLLSGVTFTVNTIADRTDPVGSTTVTLRDAIAQANKSNLPATIQFNSALFAKAQTITLGASPLELSNTTEPIAINGPAAGVTIDAAASAGGFIIDKSVAARLTRVSVTQCRGAAIVNNGNLSLVDSTLSNNTGRALYDQGTGSATLYGDTLVNNSMNSSGGGAIDNSYGIDSLSDCTLTGNSSTGNGGAVLNDGGKLYLYNDTLAGNSAGSGGGVYTFAGGTVAAANTIIAQNSSHGTAPDVYGMVMSKGHNLIGQSNGSSGWLTSDLVGTTAHPLNPELGALQNNGGPTLTMSPLTGSPVINQGTNALIQPGTPTDQRGLSRIMNGTVDIGAVEVQKPGLVDATVNVRYGNELVITATGPSDALQITESGSILNITVDGITATASVPASGIFVYTRGGNDSVTIASSVMAQTTVDSIDNAPTRINSAAAHVIVWDDSSDVVTGSASVHSVAAFADGVSKALGASLANPSDSGATITANLSLFGTGPRAADVNEGGIGDCYFLSTLAAFADQRPRLLLNSAVDLGDGTYAVEFYQDGSPVFIRVNDSFPAGSWAGFAYAHPGPDNTIWAMVMEKAFADFRLGQNTYASIAGGWPSEVFADLGITSADFTPGDLTDPQLFDMLSSDLQDGDPVTFVTPMNLPDLVADHAYSLISVQVVGGVNEYTVRNPWGFSGDSLENGQGFATLTYQQLAANFEFGTAATI